MLHTPNIKYLFYADVSTLRVKTRKSTVDVDMRVMVGVHWGLTQK